MNKEIYLKAKKEIYKKYYNEMKNEFNIKNIITYMGSQFTIKSLIFHENEKDDKIFFIEVFVDKIKRKDGEFVECVLRNGQKEFSFNLYDSLEALPYMNNIRNELQQIESDLRV